jgi:hypothetical protein
MVSSRTMRGALLSAVMLAAACYQPAIQSGVPCSRSGDCPGGEACIEAVCGGPGPSPGADARGAPDASIDAPPGIVTVVVGASKSQLRDTEITLADPDVTYGDQDHLSVDDNELSLLRFDLSGVPAGSLTKATLKVLTTDDASEDGGTVLVYRMLEGWDEADATWFLRAINQQWTSAGANPPSREDTPIAQLRPNQTFKSFEIALPVPLVAAWRADPASNFGLALVRGTSSQHVHLASRERGQWSTLTLELRP